MLLNIYEAKYLANVVEAAEQYCNDGWVTPYTEIQFAQRRMKHGWPMESRAAVIFCERGEVGVKVMRCDQDRQRISSGHDDEDFSSCLQIRQAYQLLPVVAKNDI